MRKSFKTRAIAAIVSLFQVAALSFANPAKADFLDDLDSLFSGKGRGATTQSAQQQEPLSPIVNTAYNEFGDHIASYPETVVSPITLVVTTAAGKKYIVTKKGGRGEAILYTTLPILTDPAVPFAARLNMSPNANGTVVIKYVNGSYAKGVSEKIKQNAQIKPGSTEAKVMEREVAKAYQLAYLVIPSLSDRGFFKPEHVPGLGIIKGVNHVNRRTMLVEREHQNGGGIEFVTSFFHPQLPGGKIDIPVTLREERDGDPYAIEDLLLLIQERLEQKNAAFAKRSVNERVRLADAMMMAMLSDIAELGNQSAMDQLLKKGWAVFGPGVVVEGQFEGTDKKSINWLIGAGLRQIFDEFLGSSPAAPASKRDPKPEPKPEAKTPETDPFSLPLVVLLEEAPSVKTKEKPNAPKSSGKPVAPSSLERKAGNRQRLVTQPPPTKAPATTPPTKQEAPPSNKGEPPSNEVRGKVNKTPDSAPGKAAPPVTQDQSAPKVPPPPPQPSFLSIFTRT